MLQPVFLVSVLFVCSIIRYIIMIFNEYDDVNVLCVA